MISRFLLYSLLYVTDTCFILVVIIPITPKSTFTTLAAARGDANRLLLTAWLVAKFWAICGVEDGRELNVAEYDSTSNLVWFGYKFTPLQIYTCIVGKLDIISKFFFQIYSGCINLRSRMIIDANFWANICNTKFLLFPKVHTFTIVSSWKEYLFLTI